MNLNGSYLVIGSTKGFVKVFDVSRRYVKVLKYYNFYLFYFSFNSELRQTGKALNINAHTPSVDTIREVATNCTGAKVTVLTSQVRNFFF